MTSVAVFVAGSSARADNECGTGSNATCTSTGNPYAGGITYNTANQTLTVQSGVVINSGANIGINLNGSGAQTLNIASGVTVTTSGSSDGVDIAGAGAGAIVISAAGSSVITTGDNAWGWGLVGTSISGTIGNVTSGGPGFSATYGVNAQATGLINLTTGSVTNNATTFGANAIFASSSGGSVALNTTAGTVSITAPLSSHAINVSAAGLVSITTANVSSVSGGADAIHATSTGTGANGAVTVDSTAGTVTTAGAGSKGIFATSTAASNSGLVTVRSGAVTTTGTGASTAISASSTSGAVTVNAGGTLTTSGNGALGVLATGKGLVSVTTKDITTNGTTAHGIQVVSGLAGAAGLTSVDSTAGTIKTLGTGSRGITIEGTAGANVDVKAGTIDTTGNNAAGIHVWNSTASGGGSISITSQNVVTRGNTTTNTNFGGADAVQAISGGSGAAGNVTVDTSLGVGKVEAFGAESKGVYAESQGGTVNVTVGTVTTHGAGGTGVSARINTGAGSLTVLAKGAVATSGSGDSFGTGRGIEAITFGSGDVSVTTKAVSTSGDNATGVYAQSSGGKVTINTAGGLISTTGAAADGVTGTFNGNSGELKITTGSVTTQGFLSNGVNGFTGGPNAALTIDTTAGTITTTGNFSAGINAKTGSSSTGVANAGLLTIKAGAINAVSNAITAQSFNGNIEITTSGAITSSVSSSAAVFTRADGTSTSTITANNTITATGTGSSAISGSGTGTSHHTDVFVNAAVSGQGANGRGITLTGVNDTVTVGSTGSVSGTDAGIVMQETNGATSVTNNGTVTGSGGDAIRFQGATSSTLINNATINGNVLMGGGTGLATLSTGSVITGTLNGEAGTDTLQLVGSGTGALDISKVTNFEIGQKTGTGTWTLTGTGTLSTSMTVSGGLLTVNGTLTSPTVTVAAGGTLGGSGTVVASSGVTVNGNIAPGNSIGTLNITGPYTQATGSRYTVEINNAGQSDLIAVSGAATIQSGTTVAVVGTPGLYTLNQRYTILTATGGVTGQYTTLTDNLPFVDFMLGSTLNSIYFDVLRNTVSFDQITRTPNQKAAAGGTQSLGTGNKIFDTLLMLDAPNARRAFDLLSGEIHASVSGTILEDSRFIRDAVTGRLRQGIGGTASIFAPQLATLNFSEDDSDAGTDVAGLMFEGDAMAYSPAKRKRVRDTMDRALPLKAAPATRGPVYTAWGQAFGNFGRTDGDGNAAALRRTTGGFITGMDVTTRGQMGDVWRAGLAVGFQHTSVDVSDRSSSGGVETYYLAAYGGRQIGALGLRAGASYGWHDISTNRSIVVPGFADATKGRYNANTAQVFGEVGYGMQWRQFAIEPFAGIAYVNLHTDSFVEGGGAAALAGAGGTTDTTYSTIGLRAAAPLPWRDLAGLIAKGSIGWRHNLGTSVPTAQLSFASGSTPFVVAGVPIARDAAAIEVGLEGRVWRNATLGIAYTGQIASSADDHGVNANFVQKF